MCVGPENSFLEVKTCMKNTFVLGKRKHSKDNFDIFELKCVKIKFLTICVCKYFLNLISERNVSEWVDVDWARTILNVVSELSDKTVFVDPGIRRL